MKRMIAVALLCCMLCACLPTPETEYVIGKSDALLEQKLNASPAAQEESVTAAPTDEPHTTNGPTEAPTAAETTSLPEQKATEPPLKRQSFPDRWDGDAEGIREYVTLSVHADVISKTDGLYPVYKTRAEKVTEQHVIALANRMLSKPVERELVDAMTKDDWAKAFQEYLNEAAEWEAWVKSGKPDTGDRDDTASYTPEEVEETSQWYMEQIKNAPDKLDKAKVSDYTGYRIGQTARYTLEGGGYALIGSQSNQSWNGFNIVKGCRHIGYVYRETQYREDSREGADASMKRAAKQWQQPTLSREDAEAIAYREMERLGYSDFSIAYGEPANLYDMAENRETRAASGWSFMMRRDYDGYPLVTKHSYASSDLLEYGDGDGYTFNKPIRMEGIHIFVDETGILYFSYDSPKTIVGKQTANVELLPFSDIQRIVKNTISVCYPGRRYQGGEGHMIELEIYRMVLTPYTLRVRDSEDFYEIPCWVVFFDGWVQGEDREQQRTQSNWSADCIVINAIDGSVVHEKAGY